LLWPCRQGERPCKSLSWGQGLGRLLGVNRIAWLRLPIPHVPEQTRFQPIKNHLPSLSALVTAGQALLPTPLGRVSSSRCPPAPPIPACPGARSQLDKVTWILWRIIMVSVGSGTPSFLDPPRPSMAPPHLAPARTTPLLLARGGCWSGWSGRAGRADSACGTGMHVPDCLHTNKPTQAMHAHSLLTLAHTL